MTCCGKRWPRCSPANPLLPTTLIVPAKPEEVVDWKRRSLSTSADFSWVVVALEEQDIDMLREALKDKRVPINVLAGPYRESPLHLAVSEVGNLDLVELLLRRHADVNALDCNGCPPLMRSCIIAYTSLLLAAGAKVNVRDSDGMTTLDYLVDCANPDDLAELRMLLEADADVNAVTKPKWGKGVTPLEQLLDGYPLFHAEASEQIRAKGLKMVQLLRAHGARTKPEYSSPGQSGSAETQAFRSMGFLQVLLHRCTTSTTSRSHTSESCCAVASSGLTRWPGGFEARHSQADNAHCVQTPLAARPCSRATGGEPNGQRGAHCTRCGAVEPAQSRALPFGDAAVCCILHTIGYHLDYHRGFRGFGELWVNRVLPEILDRESRRPLRVPDVLSMRRTELARELALRGFKDYECTPFMTAEELSDAGLDDPSQKVLMVGELLKEIGAIEDEDE